MAVVSGMWAEALKCSLNPSSSGYWHYKNISQVEAELQWQKYIKLSKS